MIFWVARWGRREGRGEGLGRGRGRGREEGGRVGVGGLLIALDWGNHEHPFHNWQRVHCTQKNVSPFDKNASAMKTFPLKISYKTVIFSIFWYPFVLFTLLPFLLCVLSAPLLIAICSSTQIFSFFLLPCLFFLLHFAMFSLCYLRPSCLLYALTVQVTASSCYSLSTSLRCHYCFYNFLTV